MTVRSRRLAFSYYPWSFSWMSLVEAADGVCEMIWVVDTELPGTAPMVRLLRRLGHVIDVAGLSDEAAADAISAAQPDGICALSDARLVWTASMAERLGLPCLTVGAAEALTDKYVQRAALRAAGLPTPANWLVPALGDQAAWDVLGEQAHFPAILKPRHGEASRDTVLIGSLTDLRRAVAGVGAVRGEDEALVLEEYLGDRPQDLGTAFAGYVSVESLVSDGQISHLAVTGRFPPAKPYRESGFFMPSALSDEERRSVLEVATTAVAGIGVDIGCLHTEIKLTPAGPRVIEVNGRIGGGVPEMLWDATGVNLLPMALRLALGDRISFDAMPEFRQVGYLFYVQAPLEMHTVREIVGLDELRAHPDVYEVTVNRGSGREVDWREGNHGHVFSVRGAVSDHEALRSMAERVHTRVQIHGE